MKRKNQISNIAGLALLGGLVGAGLWAAADFDGDGSLDLVTANAASRSVSILLGRGDLW